MKLADEAQRAQATDISHSYIVQAPAGSGKTEILTQRFLKLLSVVRAPEQIIALTFTRKAANEMRERIILALQEASEGAQATSLHKQRTLDYAKRALKRDQALDWNLLQHPTRLKIITIDSLCQSIVQSIPLQENQLHHAKISEKPTVLYQAAARATFHYAAAEPDYYSAIKTLLYHLDNRQDLLFSLFSDLLSKRDQWLDPLYQARVQDKTHFEEAIAWIEQHELKRFKQSLPNELKHQVLQLVQRLMKITGSAALTELSSLDELNSQTASQLASTILTKQQTLRKRFDHHVDLKRGACPDSEYNELKQSSQQLFEQLAELPDFVASLIRVSKLPSPEYEATQWEVLQALFKLLPLLVAHLSLLFAEQDCVDFIAVSQQALQALGDSQHPTDLSLYLDHQLQHLLIDEFQDTSIQQFQFLSQLVQGFEPNDGRTLFVVGDPMQSIYRFRSAEVGLFLRAQSDGIGPVKLTPLALTCNFRSTATIVNWVNQQFQSIFPKRNDISSGAIAFHPSNHVQTTTEATAIQAFEFEEKEDEATRLIAQVKEELQRYPKDQLAILVRSRRQLSHIVQMLRHEGIPFQGVDIDLLSTLPHLRDVWSLTQALLKPADRLAWLALLRGPFCGLSLADLHCIAHDTKSQSIYAVLSRINELPDLSDDGRLRATYLYGVVHRAFTNRQQQSLSAWVIETLDALHLHSILTPSEQDDLDQFWILLEQYEQDGQIPDLRMFQEALNALYSKKVTPARLQIMTIHKSKGLEFDAVFLPGLGSKSNARDTPLLRWLTLPTAQHQALLLCSPMKAFDEEECLLYDYLGKIDAEKNAYEMQRLLYVAVTRAKKRLYLFDHHTTNRPGSLRSLLEKQVFHTESKREADVSLEQHPEQSLPNLYRLPIDFYRNTPPPIDPTSHQFFSMNTPSLPRLIGIVAHELLQWICTYHPSKPSDIPWHLAEQPLIQAGLTNDERQHAMHQLTQQINQLFQHPIGQWLIKAHTEEKNEYEILKLENETSVTRIIDRTFYHQQTRWIIDFKTGQDDPYTETKHRAQVNEYANLLAPHTQTPIRCGLYYLVNSRWVEWEV